MRTHAVMAGLLAVAVWGCSSSTTTPVDSQVADTDAAIVSQGESRLVTLNVPHMT